MKNPFAFAMKQNLIMVLNSIRQISAHAQGESIIWLTYIRGLGGGTSQVTERRIQESNLIFSVLLSTKTCEEESLCSEELTFLITVTEPRKERREMIEGWNVFNIPKKMVTDENGS